MYYRLNSGYILRGFQKATGVMIQRSKNLIQILKPQQFNVLMLSDGVTPVDVTLLTGKEKAELQKLQQNNVITAMQEPAPLDEDQLYRYYDNRIIKSVFWSVTGRCNFRCRHCYMDAPTGMLGEMGHEEAMHFIDEMAECGVLKVDITGGEPFIRKDFWELIDRMLEHRITIGQVYTNGWLLNDQILDEFERRGLKPEFSISFDGLGWHDWMRGVPGAEKRALEALALLKKRGFISTVEMCIHKGNVSSIRATALRLAELGISSLRIGTVASSDLWKKNSQGYDMTNREYTEALIDYIPRFFEDGMPCNLLLGGIVRLKKDSTDYQVIPETRECTEQECENRYLCGSVRMNCYVTPEGRLLPCMPMTSCEEQNQFPLVQEIGLKKGLSDSFYMQFVNSRVKDFLAANEECNACPHKLQCRGGCRATALMETHDLWGKDSMQCMLWQNNYPARIREVADAAIAKYCPPKD